MDYTWEINAKDFQFGTQRGYITSADIDAFVGELINTYECTATHPTKDTWYLTDLSFADYEDLERNYWKEVGYYISAKSENVNSSKRGAKMIKRTNTLNSAVDATGNVTLTIPYYIWRLVYTCVFGYSERSSDIIYGDGKWDAELNSTIHKLESALHGTWDTLHINRDPDSEKMDFYLDTNTTPDVEAVTLTAKDNKSIPVTFTALECQVIYRCIEVMADQYADCYQFSTDDLDACYNIQKYIEDQLQMTGRQIIDATAFETEFDSAKRGANMIKRSNKLNSAADMFNEKAFDHYVKSLVADCVEYAGECGDPVQIIEGMYPGYNWEWAAEGTDPDWDRARKELENALYKYIKMQYLAYKK